MQNLALRQQRPRLHRIAWSPTRFGAQACQCTCQPGRLQHGRTRGPRSASSDTRAEGAPGRAIEFPKLRKRVGLLAPALSLSRNETRQRLSQATQRGALDIPYSCDVVSLRSRGVPGFFRPVEKRKHHFAIGCSDASLAGDVRGDSSFRYSFPRADERPLIPAGKKSG
jgi:hypothetical protein